MSELALSAALSPYELGLSDSPDAIPHLIWYLKHGRTNEKRLAASAIRKLAPKYSAECQATLQPLVACLDDPGPQVRQYILKALLRLRLPPDTLERIRTVQTNDDRVYNRDLAAIILNKYARTTGVTEVHTSSRSTIPLQLRIEASLDALDSLEEDLQDNLTRLWEAEDELTDSRATLQRAEEMLIVGGIEGKNETERRARLAAALTREREAVETAERHLRLARRERDEYNAALHLIQERLKALELLVSVRLHKLRV